MLTNYCKRSEDTASRIIDEEAVIVIPSQGEVKVLNDTGAMIWQLLDGKKTSQDIINTILSEFKITPEEAQADVLNFLTELKEKGMVNLSDEPIM